MLEIVNYIVILTTKYSKGIQLLKYGPDDCIVRHLWSGSGLVLWVHLAHCVMSCCGRCNLP